MRRKVDMICWLIVPLVWLGVMLWSAMFFVRQCRNDGALEGDTVSVVRDTVAVRDTVVSVVRDTVPVVRRERVVCYVAMPTGKPSDTLTGDGDTTSEGDTVREDEPLTAVVQREYSDDSTYTAWVSGLAYEVWPKLDSIHVRQRTVVETVTVSETVTLREKATRWSVGVVGGYGYGVRYGGFEPFVGIGVSYRIFPP